MKPLDAVLADIRAYDGPPARVMEICGTHTAAILRSGLRELLPLDVRLLSGPGCPVCVTPAGAIDRLVELSLAPDTCVVCFGDMLRVPGTAGSLAEARARGGQVRMIYTPLAALSLAKEHPQTRFVLAAVGFETTAPVFALAMKRAREEGLANLRFVTALKTVFPAVELVMNTKNPPDALICPGHVGAVTGQVPFAALAARYGKPFVMAGFEPAHVAAAVWRILRMLKRGEAGIQNLYPEVVRPAGNPRAAALLEEVYTLRNSDWRGLGVLPNSGYAPREPYAAWELGYDDGGASDGCACGAVLLGEMSPPDCPLYGQTCTPASPVGPCMVSGEGACGLWYSGGGAV